MKTQKFTTKIVSKKDWLNEVDSLYFIMNNTLFWKSALVFSLVLFLYSRWQSSQGAWREYDDICSYSFGKSESYSECMSFFYKQKSYFIMTENLSYAVATVSILLLAKNLVIKKKGSTKKLTRKN